MKICTARSWSTANSRRRPPITPKALPLPPSGAFTSASSTLAPQPIHQNVDESPRARFPALVGIPITHSDQRTQQVRRIDIFAHIAACDGTLHERRDRTGDQFSRGCIKRGSTACRSSQRWCDQALGGDVVDE